MACANVTAKGHTKSISNVVHQMPEQPEQDIGKEKNEGKRKRLFTLFECIGIFSCDQKREIVDDEWENESLLQPWPSSVSCDSSQRRGYCRPIKHLYKNPPLARSVKSLWTFQSSANRIELNQLSAEQRWKEKSVQELAME